MDLIKRISVAVVVSILVVIGLSRCNLLENQQDRLVRAVVVNASNRAVIQAVSCRRSHDTEYNRDLLEIKISELCLEKNRIIVIDTECLILHVPQ